MTAHPVLACALLFCGPVGPATGADPCPGEPAAMVAEAPDPGVGTDPEPSVGPVPPVPGGPPSAGSPAPPGSGPGPSSEPVAGPEALCAEDPRPVEPSAESPPPPTETRPVEAPSEASLMDTRPGDEPSEDAAEESADEVDGDFEDTGEDPEPAAGARPVEDPAADGSPAQASGTPPAVRRSAPAAPSNESGSGTGSAPPQRSPAEESSGAAADETVQVTVPSEASVEPEEDGEPNPVGHFAFEETVPVGAVGRTIGAASTTLLALLGVGTLVLRLMVGWPRFPTPYLGRRRCRTEDGRLPLQTVRSGASKADCAPNGPEPG
ncbi:hypothetical protein GCM10027590_63160 [Nocardiopsis nanhaiensis]